MKHVVHYTYYGACACDKTKSADWLVSSIDTKKVTCRKCMKTQAFKQFQKSGAFSRSEEVL